MKDRVDDEGVAKMGLWSLKRHFRSLLCCEGMKKKDVLMLRDGHLTTITPLRHHHRYISH